MPLLNVGRQRRTKMGVTKQQPIRHKTIKAMVQQRFSPTCKCGWDRGSHMQIMVPCPRGDTDPTTWVTWCSGTTPCGTDPTTTARSHCHVARTHHRGGSHLVHVEMWVPLDRTGGSRVHAGPLLRHGPTTRWHSTSTSAPTIPVPLNSPVGHNWV